VSRSKKFSREGVMLYELASGACKVFDCRYYGTPRQILSVGLSLLEIICVVLLTQAKINIDSLGILLTLYL
jgi:hypothetical protein